MAVDVRRSHDVKFEMLTFPETNVLTNEVVIDVTHSVEGPNGNDVKREQVLYMNRRDLRNLVLALTKY